MPLKKETPFHCQQKNSCHQQTKCAQQQQAADEEESWRVTTEETRNGIIGWPPFQRVLLNGTVVIFRIN